MNTCLYRNALQSCHFPCLSIIICYMACSGFLYADLPRQGLLTDGISIILKDSDLTLIKTTKYHDKQSTEITLMQSKEYSVTDHDKYSVVINMRNMKMHQMVYDKESVLPHVQVITVGALSFSLDKHTSILYNGKKIYPLELVKMLSQ